MRKVLVMFSLIALVYSCGSNESKEKTADNKSSLADPTKHPDYQKGLELVGNSDCYTCHKVADKFAGPAYTEVAKRYAGQKDIVDTLAQRVIKGSVGHWGTQVMTPHPNLSVDDARAMVKYVLTLNQ